MDREFLAILNSQIQMADMVAPGKSACVPSETR